MQKLAELCVRRPIFASVIILILVVVGAAGFLQLGVERYPNVDFVAVSVTTRQPGASAETVESTITEKIEESVNTIAGIEELRSTSSDGLSVITVQFLLEKRGDVAAQEVRDRVNRILADLPQGVDPPVVEKFDNSGTPVITLALSGKSTARDTTEFADKVLRRRLETASGVGRVQLLGGQKRQINVHLDAHRMQAYGLTVTDVLDTLQNQNSEFPGGRLDQGKREVTLRPPGRLENVPAFGLLRVKTEAGAIVRLRDVARVEDGVAEAESISSVSGQPTVILEVAKQSGANTVAVVDAVQEKLKDLELTIRTQGYTVRVVSDDSEYVRASVKSVEKHLVEGSLLAVFTVLLFLLNWRSTIIAAMAVPASIVATFGLMWAMGFTLNTLTLLALTLSVGIVIDDAIVVLENIYRHIEEKGIPPFQAAIEATREIGLAVLATTLSLVAVFLPVAFMSGIVGRFMNSFGLTMAFAILVSLLVAFTLTPTMSARLLRSPHEKSTAPAGTLTVKLQGAGDRAAQPVRALLGAVDTVYLALLSWCLKRRWVVVLACLLSLVSIPFVGSRLPAGFLPENDESQFEVTLRAPEGTSLQETGRLATAVGRAVQKLDGVAYTMATIGATRTTTGRNRGRIFVKLKPANQREASQEELIVLARDRVLPLFDAEGLAMTVRPVSDWGGEGDVNYAISGPDLEQLECASARIMARLQREPGVVDVDSNLIGGSPQLAASVNRDAAATLGVQPSTVARALNALVGQNEVTRYEEGREQYEVHVRADDNYRKNKEGLGLLTVRAGSGAGGGEGAALPLAQVVEFVPRTGPSSINRLNRQRQVTVSANLLPGTSPLQVASLLEKEFRALNLGAEYSGAPVGESREQAKAFMAFLLAFGLSFVFMYLVLAAQFESWLHPITILLSLPLTVPFALISLLLFGQGINIFSMLGILVLFGVVKKNSILQIDHTIQLRERGLDRETAILQANRDRLRPILMTTVAFVAGMLPLILSQGVGAGDNHAIASVIIGGQTLSLLLTLLATPVAYSLFDDWSAAWQRLWRRVGARSPGVGSEEPA